ncbi:uncharacterized protein [Temnothorax nylanderi]|uniref:uncharacterized protein n=1 Tax=Temnothorax nylanderi TaxID=102681 RepID=UPI003A8B8B69
MDNVYVLQHVVKRELRKKGGKVYGFFVDLKAAFDRVDRKVLWEAMEKRGIRKGLIERTKEIYEDVEEMRTGQAGGMRVGTERIWTLAYADDLVLLAKSVDGMKEMIRRLERYLRRKKLQLNTEKSKIMCFKRGGGRGKEVGWEWEGKRLEEVREYKYLGYELRRNGSDGGQIKSVKKKANIVMRQVWGLGEHEALRMSEGMSFHSSAAEERKERLKNSVRHRGRLREAHWCHARQKQS